MPSNLKITHKTHDEVRGRQGLPSPSTSPQEVTRRFPPRNSGSRSPSIYSESSSSQEILLAAHPRNGVHEQVGSVSDSQSASYDAYLRHPWTPPDRSPPSWRQEDTGYPPRSSSRAVLSHVASPGIPTLSEWLAQHNAPQHHHQPPHIVTYDDHPSSGTGIKSNLDSPNAKRQNKNQFEDPRPAPIPPQRTTLPHDHESKTDDVHIKSPRKKIPGGRRLAKSVEQVGMKFKDGIGVVSKAITTAPLLRGQSSSSSNESFGCLGRNHDAESHAVDKLYFIDNEDEDYGESEEEQENDYEIMIARERERQAESQRQHGYRSSNEREDNADTLIAQGRSKQVFCEACKKRSVQSANELCGLCGESFARANSHQYVSPNADVDIHGGGDLPSDYMAHRQHSSPPPTPPPKDYGYIPRRAEQSVPPTPPLKDRDYLSARLFPYHGTVSPAPQTYFEMSLQEYPEAQNRPWHKTRTQKPSPLRLKETERKPKVLDKDSRILDAMAADMFFVLQDEEIEEPKRQTLNEKNRSESSSFRSTGTAWRESVRNKMKSRK